MLGCCGFAYQWTQRVGESGCLNFATGLVALDIFAAFGSAMATDWPSGAAAADGPWRYSRSARMEMGRISSMMRNSLIAPASIEATANRPRMALVPFSIRVRIGRSKERMSVPPFTKMKWFTLGVASSLILERRVESANKWPWLPETNWLVTNETLPSMPSVIAAFIAKAMATVAAKYRSRFHLGTSAKK